MSRRWLTGCDCRLPSLPRRAADHVPQAARRRLLLCGRRDGRISGCARTASFLCNRTDSCINPRTRPDIGFENF